MFRRDSVHICDCSFDQYGSLELVVSAEQIHMQGAGQVDIFAAITSKASVTPATISLGKQKAAPLLLLRCGQVSVCITGRSSTGQRTGWLLRRELGEEYANIYAPAGMGTQMEHLSIA